MALKLNADVNTGLDGATPPALAAGRPAGNYPLSDFESVNLFGGNLQFTLPIARTLGSQTAAIPIYLTIEKRWVMHVDESNGYYSLSPIAADQFGWERPYGPGTVFVRTVGRIPQPCSGAYSLKEVLTRLTFKTADGTEHEFVDALTGGAPSNFEPTQQVNPTPPICDQRVQSRGSTWVTRDGFFMTLVLDSELKDRGTVSNVNDDPTVCTGDCTSGATLSGKIYLNDGTRYTFVDGLVTQVRDRNGRFTTYTYGSDPLKISEFRRVLSILDPAGRTTKIAYEQPGAKSGETKDIITFPGSGGTPRTVEVYRCKLTSGTSDCTGYSGPAGQTPSQLFQVGDQINVYNPTVVARVVLPDSRTYIFSYNSYGELTRAVLPTGGAIEWDHGPGAGASSLIGPYTQSQIYRRVLERRTVLETGSVATKTSYTAEHSNLATDCPSPATYCTKVSENLMDGTTKGRVTKHIYSGGADDPKSYFWAGYYPDYLNGKELQTEELDPTKAPMPVVRTIAQGWQQRVCDATEKCPGTISAGPGSPVDPRVWKRSTTLGGTVGSTQFEYDRFNNVKSLQEYGFSNELIRKTETAYLTTNVTQDYVNVPVHIRNLPESVVVSDATGTLSKRTIEYDRDPLMAASATQYDSNVGATRGNITAERQWLDLSDTASESSKLKTVRSWFETGNLKSETDANGNITSFAYQCNDTVVGSITRPEVGATSIAADCNTLQVTSITDPNSIVETRDYSGDLLDRLQFSSTSSLSKAQYKYLDASRKIQTLNDQATFADGLIKSELVYDGLGRKIKEIEYRDATVTVETQYDGLGRLWRVSNPYGGTAASAWTTTTYDVLGRINTVTSPDGSTTKYEYNGATTTITDPAPTKKALTYDAAGRLKSVTQYDGTSEYTASYMYDGRDLLKTATYAGKDRTYSYDAAGRLLWTDNPESGKTYFGEFVSCQAGTTGCPNGTSFKSGYDGNGNLLVRTDARSVVTHYSYDGLNRLRSKWYDVSKAPSVAPTGAVTFSYDTEQAIAGATAENRPKGRLVSVSNGTSQTQYRYDGLGRPLASLQSTGGSPYRFLYTYKPAGLSSVEYPSHRTIGFTYGDGGRVTALNGNAQSSPYASSVKYSLFGAVSDITLGNGLTEKWTFNVRAQPASVSLGTSSVPAQAGSLSWRYCGDGSLDCAANNGNLLMQTIAPLGQSQIYSYDGLNRLSQVVERTTTATGATTCSATSTVPCRQFGYTQSGNMYVSASAAGFQPGSFTPLSESAFDTNNRLNLTGFRYDDAGNQIQMGAFAMTFDAENRLVQSSVNGTATVYQYDGEGKRVQKGETVFVYDASGQLAAEYGGTPNSAAGRRYLTVDHLGSTRIVTDETGAVVDGGRRDMLPFGESLVAGVNGRTTALKYGAAPPNSVLFTGKERDSETASSASQGLDYFGARYYSGAQGRFTSPDQPFNDQNPADPQSWNLYTYVRNNPLGNVDPSGRSCIDTTTGDGKESKGDDGDGKGCAAAGVASTRDYQPPKPNDTSDITPHGSTSDERYAAMPGSPEEQRQVKRDLSYLISPAVVASGSRPTPGPIITAPQPARQRTPIPISSCVLAPGFALANADLFLSRSGQPADPLLGNPPGQIWQPTSRGFVPFGRQSPGVDGLLVTADWLGSMMQCLLLR